MMQRLMEKLCTVAHPSKLLDNAVKKIIEKPDIGDLKKGDLAGVRVHKYKHANKQYLLGYRYSGVIIFSIHH